MTRPDDRLLPVFVYGTLRVGGRFHDRYLADRFVSVRPATLRNAQMWDNHGSYPMVVVGASTGAVTGEVFDIVEDRYDEVLAGLDHLEGHVPGRRGSLYEREVVEVEAADGVVSAWIYVMASSEVARLDADLPRLPGGDWLDRPIP